ncbi:MAG: type II toxin-antitoxin system RelE/ParE family toxin, partial [Abitibacteriaceae bacterium]|nr:type II toxin-antitoxin system RelE/ParE family toxin [Abditibacteriaceae bacterium]
LAQAAERDIAEAVAHIAEDSPPQASQWLDGLFTAIDTLGELPSRYAMIPESVTLSRPLRSLPYHSHRIIYEINEAKQLILVVRVYHSARKPLKGDDLDD